MSRIHEIFSKTKNEPQAEAVGKESPEEKEVVDLPRLMIDNSPNCYSEFQCLYRNLTILGGGKVRTVMVCGAEEGEGTTTIAMNLAALMAREEEVPTLLVEANCSSPTFFKHDGGHTKEGLYELLVEQGPIENYVAQTSIPQLVVMEAGRPTGGTKGAFTSSKIENAVAECKSQFPIIVFDAAPVNTNTESLELAKHVDGVVLVVKSEALAENVQRTKEALERVRARILGVVFNRQKVNGNSVSKNADSSAPRNI
jgi:capsular exopolysaccharide synthesis family protein